MTIGAHDISYVMTKDQTPRTKLDMILDKVKPRECEVTLDVDGYSQEQIERVKSTAEARGLHVSGSGQWLLIRDLRS